MKTDTLLDRLIRNWPAKILSIAAAVFLFLFYRFSSLDERNFSVPLDLRVAEGFMPAGPYPHAVRISLRGPGDQIFLILEEEIAAYVDFTDHTTEGLYRKPVSYTRGGSALRIDPLEISVDPTEVTVAIERRIERTIAVTPVFSGHPQKGYELGQYFVSPEEISVRGPRSSVEDLDEIRTESIDLDDRTEDFTVTVSVNVDTAPVELSTEGTVVVHCTIQEAIVLKTFSISDLVALDIPQGVTLVSDPIAGTIQVQGTQLELESLTPESFFLTVDCSDVPGAGTYTLPVRPETPPGPIVLKYEPQTVTLEFASEGAAGAVTGSGGGERGEN